MVGHELVCMVVLGGCMFCLGSLLRLECAALLLFVSDRALSLRCYPPPRRFPSSIHLSADLTTVPRVSLLAPRRPPLTSTLPPFTPPAALWDATVTAGIGPTHLAQSEALPLFCRAARPGDILAFCSNAPVTRAHAHVTHPQAPPTSAPQRSATAARQRLLPEISATSTAEQAPSPCPSPRMRSQGGLAQLWMHSPTGLLTSLQGLMLTPGGCSSRTQYAMY